MGLRPTPLSPVPGEGGVGDCLQVMTRLKNSGDCTGLGSGSAKARAGDFFDAAAGCVEIAGSISMPMKRAPGSHATPVVPEPMKGSSAIRRVRDKPDAPLNEGNGLCDGWRLFGSFSRLAL